MYNYGNLILNSVMVITSIWIVYRFWQCFFEKKKTSLFSITIWIFYCIIQMFFQYNRGNINLTRTFTNILLILLIAISGYNCRGNKKYFLLFVFSSVWCLSEEFIFFLIKEINSNSESLNVIGVIISYLIMIIFVYLVSMIKNEKNGEIIPNNFYLFLLFIPIGSIYIAINEFYSTNNRFFIMTTISILLLFNVVIFEIYIKINELFSYEKEKTVYAQQVDIISGNTIEQKKIIEEFHEEKHNLINELIVIKAGIENGDNNTVVKNLDKIIHNYNNIEGISNSGNTTIDTIINFKYAIAKEYGINFRLKIFIPSELPIEQCDIGVVLGNAIDNAIEAVKECKIKDKIIEISIGAKKEACVIIIKNSYENKIKRNKNGKILSTKKDTNRHGYGLKSIEKIASKYQGEIIIDIDYNTFLLTIILNFKNF